MFVKIGSKIVLCDGRKIVVGAILEVTDTKANGFTLLISSMFGEYLIRFKDDRKPLSVTGCVDGRPKFESETSISKIING